MSTTVDLGKITASVTVGTTTTGAAGTNASVSNSGTTQDAVLNFTIPRGAQGEQGPQGVQGPQGNQGNSGYTGAAGELEVVNNLTQGGATAALSAEMGRVLAQNNSYYEATISGGSITVSGSNYLLSTVGEIRIKMPSAGTGASTLTIGNANAVQLWYNGAAVSAQNTWEADEIISVFYDGTRFMASNSQGGGGKAEKISYNNSQSGLAAENVQGALDETGKAIFELSNPTTIPAGTSTKQYYTYQNGSIVIGSNTNFRCWSPIDISKYYALRINFYLPVNANPAAAKTFFTDENDVMVGDFLYNTSGDYKEYIVPEGAKKLYWSTNYNIQSSVGLRGITRTNKIDEKVDKKDFLLSLTPVENYAGKEYHNGAFSSVSNATCRKYDVAELDTIYVTTRWSSQSAGYYKVVFVDEENTTISQLFVNTAGVDVTLTRQKVTVPSNAKYVYVNNRYGVGMPIVEIEGSGTVIEEKINENSVKKEISILFIGNSLTQDAVTYVPLLLRELAPDLKFKIYIWYNGGYKLSQQLSDFNNNVACDIFSVCENGTSWANFNNSVTMASVLATYMFDIVCIQEYFNYQEISDVTTFNSVVEYIENHYAYPFKVVTLFHQPKRDTPAVIFERTKAGNALFLKDTVAEDMIPSGIAIYRALSTSLDSLGDQGHLSPDGTHAQEGLPCMMQAYVTAMWILKQVGIPMSVNNASSIVDNSNYDSINVPGQNLGTGVVIGTTEQVRLSQLVAIKAFKEGEYFVNANLTEYTT